MLSGQGDGGSAMQQDAATVTSAAALAICYEFKSAVAAAARSEP